MSSSNNQEVSLSRQELYELVWAQPLTNLAKQFGLSDVGFAKKCRRLKIPMPGRGYWQKLPLKNKPALPINGDIQSSVTFKTKKEKIIVAMNDQPVESDVEQLIDFELKPENKIGVVHVIKAPHPLVAAAEQSLRNDKWPRYGKVGTGKNEPINITVSPAEIGRAIRLMNALVAALQIRGYPVITTPNYYGNLQGTRVRILGEEVEFVLVEPTNQIRRKLTPARYDKRGRLVEPAREPYPTFDHIPTGKFQLKIQTWGDGLRKTWSDTRNQKLEDCLNDFIVGLIKIAAFQREKTRERAREAKERQERERLAQERARLIAEEKARVQTLERQAENWVKSNQIRNFIAAVRENAISRLGTIDPGSDTDKWIEWALQQADRLDPLKEIPRSIVDDYL